MRSRYELLGEALPENKDLQQDAHKDKILRHLDCAAIEFMHANILRSKVLPMPFCWVSGDTPMNQR